MRRLDGEYEGLEEWVPAVRLVAPWDEADALLKDEQNPGCTGVARQLSLLLQLELTCAV